MGSVSISSPMNHTFRKIPCISLIVWVAALAAIWGAGTAQARGGPKLAIRPDLTRAALSQKGESLIVSLWTRKPVPLAALDRLPKRGGAAPYLCLSLARAGRGGERRLCLGGGNAHHRAGLLVLVAGGKATAAKTIPAKVKRPVPQHLVLTLLPGRAGLTPHRYEWRALE